MCIFLSMCSSVKGKTFIKNFPSNAEKILQFSVKIRNYPNIWTFSPQKLNNSVIYPTSGWNSPQKFILPNLLPRWLDNGHTPYYIFIHSVWNDKKSINTICPICEYTKWFEDLLFSKWNWDNQCGIVLRFCFLSLSNRNENTFGHIYTLTFTTNWSISNHIEPLFCWKCAMCRM